ncbi:hypothetical protein BTO30_05105 [Domibacillus antri]|uniref:Prepilin-type N-terminal cleavage/methylation domain-containing protein n=1 Tax=Domibacillus antri TaxID=1714264 RepID=A0A1Q8Q7N0_9BACI|nr:hypothetical protein [Domibacillus antri]OLN23346.1 hypothetical protein BTO30_05105 [Domibacillus antri]
MGGGAFIFWKNEDGFTLSESILALSALLIAATVILPLCFKMAAETSSRWEQQEGMRRLYEEAEWRIYEPAAFSHEVDQPNFSGRIFWKTENGKDQACVSAAGKTTCVSEQ